jgi:hypothetical protein
MPDAAGTRVTPKLRVLFLCTGNSCRSQMAEGWARHLKGEVIDAYSAGTHPKGPAPLAVQVIAEVGGRPLDPPGEIPRCCAIPALRLCDDRLS